MINIERSEPNSWQVRKFFSEEIYATDFLQAQGEAEIIV